MSSNRISVAAALTVLASCAAAFAGPSGTLQIELAETPIEQGSLRTMLGIVLRADRKGDPQDGAGQVFSVPGQDAAVLRNDHGSGKIEVSLSAGGKVWNLAECGGSVFGNMKAFGPARISDRMPAVTVHVPIRRAGSATTAIGYAYLMPASMLAGTVDVDGRAVRFALIDANLDGDCSDPCSQHMRSGDWFAADLDGDSRLSIDQSGNEGRPLTRRIEFCGATWSWDLNGRTLTLTPAAVGIFQVRIEGLGSEADVYGWSGLTGFFRASTRRDGSFEVPDGDAQLYNYTIASGDWKAVGTLGAMGRITSPGCGGERAIKAGPPMSAELGCKPGPDSTYLFSAKITGSGGESFTLSRASKQAPPAVLVIIGPDGAEAHRATMTYG